VDLHLPKTPDAFLRAYERCTNTHRFDEVAPLIAEDAVYWFSDGSFRGRDAIRQAFESTWNTIRDEQYTLADVHWLARDDHTAVCVYHFHWRGLVDGQPAEGRGRGTSVLRRRADGWVVVHEHLSPIPAQPPA
jgi:ketosteroid isomerase-like protein